MNASRKKITLVTQDFGFGGAGRAAERISRALSSADLETKIVAENSVVSNSSIDLYAAHETRSGLANYTNRFQISLTNRIWGTEPFKSTCLIPSNWPSILNSMDHDYINLHWVFGSMLSVKCITKLNAPIVWSLHDLWLCSGPEHYPGGGWWCGNGSGETLTDWIKYRWIEYKKRNWSSKEMKLISPSYWLAEEVSRSPLFNGSSVDVIPNPIDTDFWRPLDQHVAREAMNFNFPTKIILFGAAGGVESRRKGFALVNSALRKLKFKDRATLVVFGGNLSAETAKSVPIPVISLGYIKSDETMKLLYSAADITVMPSAQEAFGQIALESILCGTPVISFKNTGAAELISNEQAGIAIERDQPEVLASTIDLYISQNDKNIISIEILDEYRRIYSLHSVGKKYSQIFNG